MHTGNASRETCLKNGVANGKGNRLKPLGTLRLSMGRETRARAVGVAVPPHRCPLPPPTRLGGHPQPPRVSQSVPFNKRHGHFPGENHHLPDKQLFWAQGTICATTLRERRNSKSAGPGHVVPGPPSPSNCNFARPYSASPTSQKTWAPSDFISTFSKEICSEHREDG